MRTILLFLLSAGSTLFLSAQQLGPSILAPGGNSVNTPNLTLDWTLGELAVQTLYNSNQLYTEGFHQPDIRVKGLVTVKPSSRIKKEFTLTVAPNPVRTILAINLDSKQEGVVRFDLWNSNGIHLQQLEGNLSHSSLEMDLSNYPAALYHLSLRDAKGKVIRTVPIVKIN